MSANEQRQTIKVFPTAERIIPDLRTNMGINGVRLRVVGKVYDPSLQGFVIVGSDPVELDFDEYYKRAVQEGALKPADEATARLCEVRWIAPVADVPAVKSKP